QLRKLQSQFLHFHHNHEYLKKALEINAKLIEANPEFMTAWNFRKLAFQHNEAQSDTADCIQSIIDQELQVVESALTKNFKSYGAWNHRKWVLSKGDTSTERALGFVNQFLKQDARNFHAWNYRRFIAVLKSISDEKELQFTTDDMIEKDCSNYSAWHNRSVLVTHLLDKKVKGYFPKEKLFKDEYEFIHNPVSTDAGDQSGWFYHLWLLDQTVKAGMPLLASSWPPHGSKINAPINLEAHALSSSVILYFNEPVEGLSSHTVSVEIDDEICKNITWSPLLSYKFGCAWVAHMSIPYERPNSSKTFQVKVNSEHFQGITSLSGIPCSQPWSFDMGELVVYWLAGCMHSYTVRATTDLLEALDHDGIKIGKLTLARLLMAYDDMVSTDTPNMSNVEEVLQLYSELMKLDLSHHQYYKHKHSLVFLKQVTSSKDSLLKYCWQYKESTSTNITGSVCLRLNSLSLSKIGSFERLLWVQSLDLSHNELHSIEGLETLQLLSCLNLGHNKLCSFTALNPLRLLKSLKVLNISHNEIGAHTVDTKWYLCSSPLSHTLDYDKKFEELANGYVKVDNFWEAYSIIGGLNLIQLNIAGNAAADERFVSFLVKLLPGLKWLDDKELK
uniref:geranylgeranyl transferase type-2 subunit alpha 1-like n=1 Tax=Erigeron canadensis TaxID=72917 RepID=UPI001CB8F60F